MSSVIVVAVVILAVFFSEKRGPSDQEWRSETIREARHMAVVLSIRGAHDYNAKVAHSPFIGEVDARVAFQKLLAERETGPVKLDPRYRWIEQQCFVDPWGTPYSITAAVVDKEQHLLEVRVTSAGPNKRFESGSGDDVSETGDMVVKSPKERGRTDKRRIR